MMITKQHIDEFNQRWDIHDEENFEQAFQGFKNRIMNIFSDIDDLIHDVGIRKFCNIFAVLRYRLRYRG